MVAPVVATSPARASSATGANVSSIQTTTFSPPADAVLVACLHRDGATTAGNTPTFTSTAGQVVLPWTAVGSAVHSSGSSGATAIAYAVVPAGGLTNLQVTGTFSAAATNNYSIKVDVVTGVDLTDIVGISTSSGSAASGISLTVAAQTYQIPGDSLTFLAATASNSGAATVPTSSSFTGGDFNTFVDTSNYRGGRGWKTSSNTGNYVITNASGSYAWTYVLFELRGQTAIPITDAGGIAGGSTVGTASVTVGDVSVGPAGAIAHTHPFGTARLDLNISASGIPNSTAFGAATVNAGIITASITHAHPVGTATVTRGDVNITGAGGIAHTHPFGTPTILGSVLYLTGIPGGSTVGTATITRGPVSLVATGIPHIHGMGTTTVTRVTSALTTEIVIRPRPRTTYELTMVARIPQPRTLPVFMELESLAWSSLSYSQKLSTPDTLDVTIKLSTLTEVVKQRLRTPAEMPTELWLYRNGKLVFAGPLLGGEMQGEDLRLSANGCLNYLMWMFISRDLLWKNWDMFQIMKGLVDHWQSADYGNFGIDTSNVGNSGVLMDASYIRDELNLVYDIIMNQAKSNNGFDITIDPVTRGLEFYYPRRGVDRSTGPEAVVFDDRNVTDTNVTFSVSPKDLATEVASISSGSGPDGVATFFSWFHNPEWVQKFGRVGAVEHFRDVNTQFQADNLNLGSLFARNQTLWIPGPNVRVTPDSDLDSYDVGDTVSYQLHNELGIQGNFRILGRTVDVDENSNESVSVSFV